MAKKEPITIVSPIFQHSPSVIFTLKSSGIDSPYKLNDKKLLFYKKDTDGFGILAMLDNMQTTPNIKRVKEKYNYDSLIDHKFDAYAGYLTNEPFYFIEKGIDINIINPANYGVDLYGDMLFTSTKEATNHPKRVEKLKEATIKGWYYALQNKDEIVKLIKEKYTKNKSIKHLTYEADAMDDIIKQKTIPIGTLDKGRIRYTVELYQKHGLIKNGIDISEYIFEPFNKNITITKEEKEWIKNNPVVKLASLKYQKPLLFLDEEGHTSGMIQDYFSIFGKAIGIDIIASIKNDKDDLHETAKLHKNYGISAALKDFENDKEYLVTNPYMSTNYVIFSKKINKEKYKSLKDLEGKRVAIIKEHRVMKDYFSQIPNIKITFASDVIDQLNKLQYDEVDAVVGYNTYHGVISENLFTDIAASFVDKKEFHVGVGVNKEHKILHGLLNKAIATLSEEEKSSIISKWIDITTKEKSKILTKSEIEYLKNKKVLNMCIDPDWMPFEKNENGKHIGMTAEYIEIMQKEINTPIKMVETKTWMESLKFGQERKCDIFSLAMPTPERLKYLDFTEPYLSVPLVLVTSIEGYYVDDMAKVINKKIAVIKGYAYTEILKEKYPNMELIEVQNLKEGLEKVRDKKVFGLVETLATTGYHIQKNYVGELKIAGKFEENWELGVGTRNDEPILQEIFNKAINQISKDKKQEILNKWISVSYLQETDYTRILKLAFGIGTLFLVVLLSIISVNRKLSLEIKNRKEAEKKLQMLSITDELTTLYNRRYFNEIFTSFINSAKRKNETICFVMLDIDHFKQYNDTYGHASGDSALAAFSLALKESFTRADDYCFRLGGEEFGVLFKGLDKEEAKRLVEGVRKKIEDLQIEHKNNSASKYLTASFGLIIKEAMRVKDENELYREADEMLYKAKSSGRNRVATN
jgi:diguanylate cyclase (GGDEF)-like protein